MWFLGLLKYVNKKLYSNNNIFGIIFKDYNL